MSYRKHHRRNKSKHPVPPAALWNSGLMSFAGATLWLSAINEALRLGGADTADLLSLWLLFGLTFGIVTARITLRGFDSRQRNAIAGVTSIIVSLTLVTAVTVDLSGAVELSNALLVLAVFAISLLGFAASATFSSFSRSAYQFIAPSLSGLALAAIVLEVAGTHLSSALAPAGAAAILLAAPQFLKSQNPELPLKSLGLAIIGGAAVVAILQVTLVRYETRHLSQLITAQQIDSDIKLHITQLPGLRSLSMQPAESYSEKGRWSADCDHLAPRIITAESSTGKYEFPILIDSQKQGYNDFFTSDIRFVAGQLTDRPSVCALDADGATVCASREIGSTDITAVWRTDGAKQLFHLLYPQKNVAEFSLKAPPRSFMESSRRRYDLVFLPPPQTASGLAVASIEHTVEAYETYFTRLSDKGFLTYTLSTGPGSWPALIRSLQAALLAMKNRGQRDPARHIALVGGPVIGDSEKEPSTITVIISAGPLSSASRERLIDMANIDHFALLALAGDIYFNALADVLTPGAGPTLTALHHQPLGPLRDARPIPFHPTTFSLNPVGSAIAANAVSGEISLQAAAARRELVGENNPNGPGRTNSLNVIAYALPAILTLGAFFLTVASVRRRNYAHLTRHSAAPAILITVTASLVVVMSLDFILRPSGPSPPLWAVFLAAGVGGGLAARRHHISSRMITILILSSAALYTLVAIFPADFVWRHVRVGGFALFFLSLAGATLAASCAGALLRKTVGDFSLTKLALTITAGASLGLIASRLGALVIDLQLLRTLALTLAVFGSATLALLFLRGRKQIRRHL